MSVQTDSRIEYICIYLCTDLTCNCCSASHAKRTCKSTLFHISAHVSKLFDPASNASKVNLIRISVSLCDRKISSCNTFFSSTNVYSCNTTNIAVCSCHGYGNIYSGRTAADSTGHLILSDNPAKSRMAHGTGRAHMSCYRSGYPAILDLTGIILCHNTMDIMTVIIKIRNNIQILYRSCILLDQRLLETGYCETGSVQRSTEIRCRKICPSVCTDIFCQTIVCSLVRLDQIKIIDRRYLIWICRCTISLCRCKGRASASNDTINNPCGAIRRNGKLTVRQLHQDCRCCRQCMVFIAISCIKRECRCLCRSNGIPVKAVFTGALTGCNCRIKIRHKLLKRNSGYFLQILLTAERRSIDRIKLWKHFHRLIASCHPVNNISYKKIRHSIVLCIVIPIILVDQRSP